MKCSKCGTDLDAKDLHASQGDTIECPSCHGQTTVTYTIKDELGDPVGAFVFRDLKYARTPLKLLALLLGVPVIICILLFGFSQKDLPALRVISIAMVCMLVAYGVRMFTRK